MIFRIRPNLILVWVCLALVGALISSCSIIGTRSTISGKVSTEHGPAAGAVVRVQATENHTTTDPNGKFTLSGLDSGQTVTITAWKSGYYIAGAQEISPGMIDVEIHLEPHTEVDNPDYIWLPSQYHPGEGEDQGCAECHSKKNTNVTYDLPVDEWLQDAHSQSANNVRFLTMYNGTDIHGNQSPLTRYGNNPDYGSFPLIPDPDQPYFGPGYKLDFPTTAGNCAACHTPAASVNNPYSVDPTRVTGVPAEGVPCDFCHKIWDTKLDPTSGMPYANMPGVLSYEFRRPPEGHQFFAGPLDDVAPGEDTYSPLQQQSQFCAPCHSAVFWDTVIYDSFGEWLESPYSDPETGRTCQDCHMPPSGVSHFALPEVGGQERDPATIYSHRMPGASDEELLQNSVTMKVEAEREDEQIIIDVNIINDQTGHHIPTDFPLRQMILYIQVADSDGNLLKQVSGPQIPDYGGIGNPAAGYYAEMPGKIYAKVLMELWTEVVPTGAYWNPTRIVSDNRIPAMQTDTTRFIFDASEASPASVHVELLFRRAFIDIMDQKGWNTPDITMEEETLLVP